jgi:D-sedoheptulose 7-phosphate isomerase
VTPTTTTTAANATPAVAPLDVVTRHLRESARTKERLLAEGGPQIVAAGRLLADVVAAGNKLLFCGNGGSAGDAQHIATELVVRLSSSFERRAIGAISLATDTSLLTACANDYGYDQVFCRQVEALGRPGDALVGITTSGKSKNVLLAMERARAQGLRTVLLSAGDGGPCAKLADVAVLVPSKDTAHIQESHIAVGHILCELIERLACGRV